MDRVKGFNDDACLIRETVPESVPGEIMATELSSIQQPYARSHTISRKLRQVTFGSHGAFVLLPVCMNACLICFI